MMRECLWDFWDDWSWWNLKTGAYAICWFGAIYRTAAILAIAIEIAELPCDKDLYFTLYSILLSYGFISLAANFIFIVGIPKGGQNYLLPYLGILGIEIMIGIVFLIGGIICFIKLETPIVLSYFIPCGIIGLGVYIYLWSCLMSLFVEFKRASNENGSVSSIESAWKVRCRCYCFKTESLDIVT